jgi:hypothetical protein
VTTRELTRKSHAKTTEKARHTMTIVRGKTHWNDRRREETHTAWDYCRREERHTGTTVGGETHWDDCRRRDTMERLLVARHTGKTVRGETN